MAGNLIDSVVNYAQQILPPISDEETPNFQSPVPLDNIAQKNQDLVEKQIIEMNQLREIQEKEKLLLTRSRMLQIAQDRNSYKKKIIYTLIALIFLIFIFTLALYVYFTRKIKTV